MAKAMFPVAASFPYNLVSQTTPNLETLVDFPPFTLDAFFWYIGSLAHFPSHFKLGFLSDAPEGVFDGLES